MTRIQMFARAAAAAALPLALAACGDDDGNGPKRVIPLDAPTMAAAAGRVSEVMDQPVVRALLSVGESEDPFETAARSASMRRLSVPAWRPPSPAGVLSADRLAEATAIAVSIPAGGRGRVYVWAPATRRWAADPARSGAPANGARFILQETSGSTVTQVGHADVIDLSTASESRLATTVFATGGAVVMQFERRHSGDITGGPWSDLSEGFVQKGASRLTFGMQFTTTDESSTSTERSRVTWALPEAGVSYESNSLERDQPTDSSWSVMRIGEQSIRIANSYRPDAEFGGYWRGDTTRVYVSDQLFAYAIFPSDGDSPDDGRIVRPDGSPISQSEENALRYHDLMLLSLFGVLFAPLAVDAWTTLLTWT